MTDNTRFIHNYGYRNFYEELHNNLVTCSSFKMSVAFVRYSGVQLLLDTFQELYDNNISGQILTSTYLNSTEPKALNALKQFSNLEMKIFVPTRDKGFHSKGYIFTTDKQHRIIIGSSNITQCALKSNVEWNVLNHTNLDDSFAFDVLNDFNTQWNDDRTQVLSDEFINEYKEYLLRLGKRSIEENAFEYNELRIEPNKMQKEAIAKLDRIRRTKEKKALAIAATGSGKTYMAVFDSLQVKPKKLLFIVHREDILLKAKDSFENIIDTNKYSTGLFTGTTKDCADYLFSTIQTLQNHYLEFRQDEFEYIIIDEAHHATSPSYQKILSYFTPLFLLGLTATPERTDSGDIYSLFDNNIAVEIRLRQALEFELVTPFHYFGITDFSEINYSNVNIDDISAVAKLLMISQRSDYIYEKMLFYGHDGYKRKALGFCASIEHAEFMAKEFNKKGINSLFLSGNDSISDRTSAIIRLESDNDPLEIIFTVDIFNEGVDIPSINTILMLRPTDSSIIFIQQIGRGLRKLIDKEFVTVLDFIGNHRKSFLMALALNGSKQFDKDSLKVSVKSSFADIPGSSHIHMDKIAKEQILAQLENERFFSLKYLKEEYFDFKRMQGNSIPKMIEYLKIDGAVDPTSFITYAKTYLQFIERVEQDSKITELLQNQDFVNIIRFFSDLLPCKRIHEFVICAYLLKNNSITIYEASQELKKHIKNPTIQTIEHSFEYLSKTYFDSSERSKYEGLLFKKSGNILVPTERTAIIFSNPDFRPWIEDILHYGIIRYEQEFGNNDYGMPHFKLYYQYTMRDTALLSNYSKAHSSFRGSGLIKNGNDYFLFINLHKGADIKDAVNYQDKFLTKNIFQWESPNSTSRDSERGQDLIYNYKRNINLHIFVRKFEEIEGVSQAFIYLGKAICQSAENDRPIRMLLAFENEVPADIYYELVTKVE